MTGNYRLHMRPSRGWGWLLAYGLLVFVIGLVALFNPLATGTAAGIMLAIGLTIYGVVAIGTAVSFLVGGARWVELLLGVIALVAAVDIFMAPLAGAITLMWVIGLWLVVSSIFHIISAIRLPIHRGWRLLLGLLDLVLGVFLLIDAPGLGLFMLTVVVAVSFLSRGVVLMGAALALRRA